MLTIMAEILASIDDINAELPSDDDAPTVVADDNNTGIIQIAVARVVRGNLSRIISNSTLAQWTTPDNTPEWIRVVAAKLIASQLYFNKNSKTSLEISETSFAQKLYDEAMKMLQQVLDGEILLEGIITDDAESISSTDFFPVDATDRAFTLNKIF